LAGSAERPSWTQLGGHSAARIADPGQRNDTPAHDEDGRDRVRQRADDLDLALDPTESQGMARALSERSDSPVEAEQAVAYYVSALRELFEEAGVLLVRDADARLLTVDATDTVLQERLAATRLALQARDLSLATVLDDWCCRPAFDLLVPFSHWVTPALLVARFDTRFFVAEMPPGQAALHDTIELSDGIWLPPERLLDAPAHQHVGQQGEEHRDEQRAGDHERDGEHDQP